MKGNLNREIGTLMSFVNTLGAEERPKRRHRNLYRLPLHWNLTCFWEPLTYFTSILHIKSSGNINSFNRKKPFHFEMSIRNWFAQLCEVDYWTVPPTSYPTKNSELKNWFSIFFLLFLWCPCSTFLESPDLPTLSLLLHRYGSWGFACFWLRSERDGVPLHYFQYQ